MTMLLKKIAELDIGRMLDRCGEHMPLLRMRDEGALNRRVIALGAAAREYEFARVRINQGRNFGSRLLDMLGHLMPKSVRARWITPIFFQKGEHRLDNLRRDTRGGIVVEIIDRRLVHNINSQIEYDGFQPFSQPKS